MELDNFFSNSLDTDSTAFLKNTTDPLDHLADGDKIVYRNLLSAYTHPDEDAQFNLSKVLPNCRSSLAKSELASVLGALIGPSYRFHEFGPLRNPSVSAQQSADRKEKAKQLDQVVDDQINQHKSSAFSAESDFLAAVSSFRFSPNPLFPEKNTSIKMEGKTPDPNLGEVPTQIFTEAVGGKSDESLLQGSSINIDLLRDHADVLDHLGTDPADNLLGSVGDLLFEPEKIPECDDNGSLSGISEDEEIEGDHDTSISDIRSPKAPSMHQSNRALVDYGVQLSDSLLHTRLFQEMDSTGLDQIAKSAGDPLLAGMMIGMLNSMADLKKKQEALAKDLQGVTAGLTVVETGLEQLAKQVKKENATGGPVLISLYNTTKATLSTVTTMATEVSHLTKQIGSIKAPTRSASPCTSRTTAPTPLPTDQKPVLPVKKTLPAPNAGAKQCISTPFYLSKAEARKLRERAQSQAPDKDCVTLPNVPAPAVPESQSSEPTVVIPHGLTSINLKKSTVTFEDSAGTSATQLPEKFTRLTGRLHAIDIQAMGKLNLGVISKMIPILRESIANGCKTSKVIPWWEKNIELVLSTVPSGTKQTFEDLRSIADAQEGLLKLELCLHRITHNI